MVYHHLAYLINLISSKNKLSSNFIVNSNLDKLILVNKGNSNTQFFFSTSTTSNYCDISNDLKWLLVLFCDRFLLLSKCILNDDEIGNCIIQERNYNCALKKFDHKKIKKTTTSPSLFSQLQEFEDNDSSGSTENYFTREFFDKQIENSNVFEDFSKNEWNELVELLGSEEESINLTVFYRFKDNFKNNFDLKQDDIIDRRDKSSFKEFLSTYFFIPKYDICWNGELIEKIFRVSRLLARRKLSIVVDDLNYTHYKRLKSCKDALTTLKSDHQLSLKDYNEKVESCHPVPSQRTSNEIQNFKQKKEKINVTSAMIKEITNIKTMHLEHIKNSVILDYIIGYDMFNVENDGLYIYIKGVFIKHIPLRTLLSFLDPVNDPKRIDLSTIWHRGLCTFINCNEDIGIETCNEINLKSDEFILRKHFKTIYLEFITTIKKNIIIYDDNVLFNSKNAVGNVCFWGIVGYSESSLKLANYAKSYEYRYFYTYNHVQCVNCKKWRELDLLSIMDRKDKEGVLLNTPDNVNSVLKELLKNGISCDHPFVNIKK
jgi:hypothetical protein